MNATLKDLFRIGQTEHAGQSTPTAQTATASASQRDNAPGSYGRGIYAGHSTHDLDFRIEGSYGRGIYAGHSTHDLDAIALGSYGRGIYAGHSTHDLDFGTQGSFASAE